MSRYEPGTPRIIVGCVALAMTALTLAVCVVAPASMDSGSRDPTAVTTLAAPRIPAAGFHEITTSVDVVAARAGAAMQTCAQFHNAVAG